MKKKKKKKTNTVEAVLCALGFLLDPFLVLSLSKVAQIPLNITELGALLSH